MDKKNEALHINKGIERPPIINPMALIQFRIKKQKKHPVSYYVNGICSGNRTILSQAITLVESRNPRHNKIAQQIIEGCLPASGKSVRIGVTGVPGVGKSTFIETFGRHIIRCGKKLAVLAIDPSSERSKGSILGDKTRMEKLSAEQNAFIRPSPAAGSLGGVANKTRETIILCEAAGFDTIFVETVGVGQSETTVHSMVDFFLLLMLAGAGDELQGIKRGIMEMADSIVITKADSGNEKKAEMAKVEYQNALHLFPEASSAWHPKVLTCSAVKNTGIEEIWKLIQDFVEHTTNNDFFQHNRQKQAKHWMYETINENLKNNFYQDPVRKKTIADYEAKILSGNLSPFMAAKRMLNDYFQNKVQ
ncbi:MAG: methylmalonyl Co-A mutase-associated GTPase MeaB [Bacteroidia bacterium]|nr:MAG: methylmalonyl Co-A mutase-associated GTPase MeaB [Bacteroidia bacterium]